MARMVNIMKKNSGKSVAAWRVPFAVAMNLMLLAMTVMFNIAWIHQINNLHSVDSILKDDREFGWRMLTILDFGYFVGIAGSAKLAAMVLLKYDETRVFESSREQIAAEQKSTVRRIANVMRHITKVTQRKNGGT